MDVHGRSVGQGAQTDYAVPVVRQDLWDRAYENMQNLKRDAHAKNMDQTTDCKASRTNSRRQEPTMKKFQLTELECTVGSDQPGDRTVAKSLATGSSSRRIRVSRDVELRWPTWVGQRRAESEQEPSTLELARMLASRCKTILLTGAPPAEGMEGTKHPSSPKEGDSKNHF